MTRTAYQQLEARFRRLGLLGEAMAILHWDHSTTMPHGAAPARAEQMGEMQVFSHELLTAPEVGDWLGLAEGDNSLDQWQRANLHEMRRSYLHATAVDADLVAARARANSACEMVWRDARPKSDFAAVLPYLEEVLRLVRLTGEAKAAVLGVGLYDALLDSYEPDGRAAEIDPIFDDLAAFLPGFIQEVLDRQAMKPALPLDGPFPVERQRELGVRLMQIIGFDFNRGRLDVSDHPFCGGTPDDLRITTRYDEDDFVTALMGVIHETGHALYERNLPEAWRRQPVGHARGMTLHESQSLLMEMQACRSPEFLDFATPLMREAFDKPADAPAWQTDNLYRIYTDVSRGFIRVDADEVTYPAHVILRYRLEKALLAGDAKLADLPGLWNEGMQELLGVAPPDDRLGCLQDIHWYDGAWGYFPTYTLGAMAAAQIYDAAKKAVPAIPAAIARGDFQPLLGWLGESVHGKGSSMSTRDLLVEATGQPLNAGIFEAHLKARYLA